MHVKYSKHWQKLTVALIRQLSMFPNFFVVTHPLSFICFSLLVCMFVHLKFCLSVCQAVCSSANLSAYLSFSVFVYPCVYVCPSLSLNMCMCVCFPVSFLSVISFVLLYLHLAPSLPFSCCEQVEKDALSFSTIHYKSTHHTIEWCTLQIDNHKPAMAANILHTQEKVNNTEILSKDKPVFGYKILKGLEGLSVLTIFLCECVCFKIISYIYPSLALFY